MKKLLSFGLLIALSLSLAACGKKEQPTMEGKTPISKEQQKQEKKLKDWMKDGDPVECKIKIDDQNEMVMMVKDEKVRIEGVSYFSMSANMEEADMENTNGVSLTVGDWTYLWDKEKKEGMKFNAKEMEELGQEFEDEEEEEDYETWEDQVNNWEATGVDYDCYKAKLDDDLFEEPKGVKFTDMGETMRGMVETGKTMEGKIEAGEMPNLDALKDLLPEGMELPEIPTE